MIFRFVGFCLLIVHFAFAELHGDIHRDAIENYKNEICKSYNTLGPQGYVLSILHGGGTQIGYQALKELPHEVRDRMVVLAVAPAKIIPQNMCKFAWNYVCPQDIVCNFAICRMKYSHNCCNITYLQRKGTGINDLHGFRGSTYFEPTMQVAERFLSRTGEFEFLKN